MKTYTEKYCKYILNIIKQTKEEIGEKTKEFGLGWLDNIGVSKPKRFIFSAKKYGLIEDLGTEYYKNEEGDIIGQYRIWGIK